MGTDLSCIGHNIPSWFCFEEVFATIVFCIVFCLSVLYCLRIFYMKDCVVHLGPKNFSKKKFDFLSFSK